MGSTRSVLSRLLLAVTLVLGVAPVSAQEVEIDADVVYGRKDGLALTFDVLRPEENANGAGVLFLVSGGWVSSYSPPEAMVTRFDELLDRGFTVFVVRHGSSPRYVIPEIVADVRLATRYIKYHAAEWGVDATRLGAFGGSAGGHLALLLGTAPDVGDPTADEPLMRADNRIASVVAYYPPVDLRPLARGRNAVSATGQPFRFPALNFERELAPAYSPLLHVSFDDPPTLLIHGDADDLVDISNSEQIFAAFEQGGVTAEFIVVPGAGHGFEGDDAMRANEAMILWFERTLLARP